MSVSVLAHPPLERGEREVHIGPEDVEHPRGQLGPLDGVPGDARHGLEGAEEAADAGRGLERVDGRPVVREARDERGDKTSYFLRYLARGVEFMGASPIA